MNKKIIDYFPKGIINSHFSLLPELRGADPLSFAILEGKATTGVSLMMLVEAMDEGPLLHQSTYEVGPNETTPSLTDKLIVQSAHDLSVIVPKWMNDEIQAYEQDEVTTKPTYTRKLNKNDSVMDFNKPAVELEREVRAYADWPKSRTVIGDLPCVITQATVVQETGTPGTLAVEKNKLLIYTSKDALQLQKIKPDGKKEMDIAGFLNGYGTRIKS